jgi:hypothetical protein
MKFDTMLKRVETLEAAEGPDKWPEVRTAIGEVLDGFPEAKDVFVEKLNKVRSAEDHQGMAWPELRIFLLDCLQPFPAAWESMIVVLEEVGA